MSQNCGQLLVLHQAKCSRVRRLGKVFLKKRTEKSTEIRPDVVAVRSACRLSSKMDIADWLYRMGGSGWCSRQKG